MSLRMLRSGLLALTAAACACAQPAAAQLDPNGLPEKTFPLPRDDGRTASTRDYAQISAALDQLNLTIGGYPTHLTSEAQRDSVYATWCDVVLDARALDWSRLGEERRLFTLAELYRDGNNLDVIGAVPLAEENITACLARFPRSRRCNFSAVWFYLATGSDSSRIAKAERSLTTLRAGYAPVANDEVEAGFVFLLLYRRDAFGAERAIDAYLQAFPAGKHVEAFRNIRGALDYGIGTEAPP